MGAKSRVYPFSAYENVFVGLPEENVVTLDCGHWVHYEKPVETI